MGDLRPSASVFAPRSSKALQPTSSPSTGGLAYRFEADSNKPSTVTCLGDCLTTWPPGLSDGSKVRLSSGVDPKLVSTVKRSDGLLQVTLDGWPLYLFEDDKADGKLVIKK
ncbi:hypothetical protein GCM10029976_042110 [Kribbella albertanoniae]|uniref:Uncharacterized protein n=1 Tax=Kribbella albertanoniae TaxID=1266829 RepID=A0A4R4QFS0_9ACTN|nr:hypothetical protein [Kribbella albertanoniae]TDC34002.1 hypothetical protein E1261_04655 [Kribbella albertanoniae]